MNTVEVEIVRSRTGDRCKDSKVETVDDKTKMMTAIIIMIIIITITIVTITVMIIMMVVKWPDLAALSNAESGLFANRLDRNPIIW